MAETDTPPPFERPLEVARLRAHKDISFDEAPTEAEAEAIRALLGLRGLRKMRFQGNLAPLGKQGWALEGHLGASITQDCVISLDPVKTRIEEAVKLRFIPESDIAYGTPEDELEDDIEPLGEVIDLGQVAVEALLLAMPKYPRSDSAAPAVFTAAPEGAAPIRDEDTKAFAGLAALRDRLEKE